MSSVQAVNAALAAEVASCAAADFSKLALKVFELQRLHNAVYREWLKLIGFNASSVSHWSQIPCAPISLFRTHTQRTGQWTSKTHFVSSGTTGSLTSRHEVRSLSGYGSTCVKTFEQQIGPLANYRLLALLPNYLERTNSGLVAMINAFMPRTAEGSGYYLHDFNALQKQVQDARERHQPVLLWGVTYALLDLVAETQLVLPKGSLIIETGGMKGRRREMTRSQVQDALKAGTTDVAGDPVRLSSEYGMTEMMSQAYLNVENRFVPAATLRVRARQLADPFTLVESGKSGALNVYDLANVHTLSFVQTEDLGRVYQDDTFEVLGRTDKSQVRGCSLLYTGTS